jgi:hypothetical protein
MPEWAFALVCETLECDSRSAAFEPKLRKHIRKALNSMVRDCRSCGEALSDQCPECGFDIDRLDARSSTGSAEVTDDEPR